MPCISKRGAEQLSRTLLTFAEDAQMNQEIGIRRPNAGANAGTTALRPLQRKTRKTHLPSSQHIH